MSNSILVLYPLDASSTICSCDQKKKPSPVIAKCHPGSKSSPVENHYTVFRGLPRWLGGKEPAYQCRRCRRRGFNPWVRKSPWSRKYQLAPVFLLGKFHGQKSLEGHSPWDPKESDCAGMHTIFNISQKPRKFVARKLLTPRRNQENIPEMFVDARAHASIFLGIQTAHSMCSVTQSCSSLWPHGLAHQAPPSMGFSKQEHWSQLPFTTPGGLPNPGIKTASLTSPALIGRFFTTSFIWEARAFCISA